MNFSKMITNTSFKFANDTINGIFILMNINKNKQIEDEIFKDEERKKEMIRIMI